jgi:transcriptional regulator with XRE-family HTH domain
MAKSTKGKKPEQANTFGGRLRAIRKSLKMNQEDFAPDLKISSQHLSDIELDKSKPCHDFFYNIVKNHHVNLNYLLFGDGEMFGGGNEKVETDIKKIKTGDKNLDEFLYYFFNSPLVYNFLMYQFRTLYNEKKTVIMDDIANAEEDEKYRVFKPKS